MNCNATFILLLNPYFCIVQPSPSHLFSHGAWVWYGHHDDRPLAVADNMASCRLVHTKVLVKTDENTHQTLVPPRLVTFTFIPSITSPCCQLGLRTWSVKHKLLDVDCSTLDVQSTLSIAHNSLFLNLLLSISPPAHYGRLHSESKHEQLRRDSPRSHVL